MNASERHFYALAVVGVMFGAAHIVAGNALAAITWSAWTIGATFVAWCFGKRDEDARR